MNSLATLIGRRPGLDPVIMIIAAIFLALAVAAPAQALASTGFVLRAALSVAPVFLVSILLTAAAAATGADNIIAKAFIGRTASMIMMAALMGALSPFCSCGVIPLIAALLAMGVPLPGVMAFWLASPLMDPAMFVLTGSVLGVSFAVAKTLAAIGVGLLGGFGALALSHRGLLSQPLRDNAGNGGCAGTRIRNPKAVVWAFWREQERRRKFFENLSRTGFFLGKMLLLAFTLESLMVAYVPQGLIASALGGSGFGTILLATALGIPAYLNGAAALPLVRELLAQGMSPGAGMAFLIGGGVTSIPAALAVWSVVRPPVFLAYLAFAAIGAVASGLAWQFFHGLV
jgi:uncharacterized membrane protein YraQ (UPF0718 family)